jgi:hypothetical protein
MFVSMNEASAGIRFIPVKTESGGQWLARFAELPESRYRPFHAPVRRHFELALARDRYLDLIAFFQIERFDDSGWKPNGQTVAPLGYLHD